MLVKLFTGSSDVLWSLQQKDQGFLILQDSFSMAWNHYLFQIPTEKKKKCPALGVAEMQSVCPPLSDKGTAPITTRG